MEICLVTLHQGSAIAIYDIARIVWRCQQQHLGYEFPVDTSISCKLKELQKK